MKTPNWLSRWRLRRIIAALTYATDYGLKKGVVDFAQRLDAAHKLSGHKHDTEITIKCTRIEAQEFIQYMARLHTSKLSLMQRARMGLATLATADKRILGETPEKFIERELGNVKHSADDKRIHIIK